MASTIRVSADYRLASVLMEARNAVQKASLQNLVEQADATLEKSKGELYILKRENAELRERLNNYKRADLNASTGSPLNKDGRREKFRLDETKVEVMEQMLATIRQKQNTLRVNKKTLMERKEALTLKIKEVQIKQEAINRAAEPSEEESPFIQRIQALDRVAEETKEELTHQKSNGQMYRHILERVKTTVARLQEIVRDQQKDISMWERHLEMLQVSALERVFSNVEQKFKVEEITAEVDLAKEEWSQHLKDRQKYVKGTIKRNQPTLRKHRTRDGGAVRSVQSLLGAAFQSVVSQTALEDEAARIQQYEDGFRRIRESTGVDDVATITEKFLNQDEARASLQIQIEEAESLLEKQTQKYQTMLEEVEQLKYHGLGHFSIRSMVNKYDAKISDAKAEAKSEETKLEHTSMVLLQARNSIENLHDQLDCVRVAAVEEKNSGPATGHERPILDLFEKIAKKLKKLWELCGLNAEVNSDNAESADSLLMSETTDLLKDTEFDIPSSNVRVDMSIDLPEIAQSRPGSSSNSSRPDSAQVDPVELPLISRDVLKREAARALQKMGSSVGRSSASPETVVSESPEKGLPSSRSASKGSARSSWKKHGNTTPNRK